MSILKGRYKIAYDNGVSQEKNLIAHADFTTIINPLTMAVEYFKSKKNEGMQELMKKELKTLIGEDDFFTDESGLYEASKTGVLELIDNMGGHKPCEVKRINNKTQ